MTKQNKSPPEQAPQSHHSALREHLAFPAFGGGTVLLAAGLTYFCLDHAWEQTQAEVAAQDQREIEYHRSHPVRPSLPCQPCPVNALR